MNTHVAQRNSIALNLTNVSTVNESTINLLSNNVTQGITTTNQIYSEVSVPNARFDGETLGLEIFRLSTSSYVQVLPVSGSGYTRDQVKTGLDAVTGYTWEYSIESAETVFYTQNNSSDYSILRRLVLLTEYPISNTSTKTGTTIQVSSSGPVTYDQLCLYLNQAPEGYLFTTCYLQANTIEQINQPITLKNIQANNVQEIVPKDVTINPTDKQLIIPNIELNHVVNNNQISYTLLAGQSCRFIFNYVKNNASVLDKPIIDILPSQLQTPEPQKTTDKEKINSAFRLFGLE
jgi:hypothetical protein